MVLPHHLGQALRPQTVRQRPGRIIGKPTGFKQVGHDWGKPNYASQICCMGPAEPRAIPGKVESGFPSGIAIKQRLDQFTVSMKR
jgi:hypothetical protein